MMSVFLQVLFLTLLSPAMSDSLADFFKDVHGERGGGFVPHHNFGSHIVVNDNHNKEARFHGGFDIDHHLDGGPPIEEHRFEPPPHGGDFDVGHFKHHHDEPHGAVGGGFGFNHFDDGGFHAKGHGHGYHEPHHVPHHDPHHFDFHHHGGHHHGGHHHGGYHDDHHGHHPSYLRVTYGGYNPYHGHKHVDYGYGHVPDHVPHPGGGGGFGDFGFGGGF